LIAEKPSRPKLVRRTAPDRSQPLRRAVQLLFLALNAWIGIQFYLFVRFYETAGGSLQVSRPAGVEGWLPIAALMNWKAWLLTGRLPALHPAGMFLLLAFLLISWLLRKSFCSWLCPIGTISEALAKLSRRHWNLPGYLDIPLRGLKYILLALFLYAVISMPLDALLAFLNGPYGIIDDVKMLNFFRFLGLTGGIVLAALILLSVFIRNFWCRYLCPYGALLGLPALLSPLRIRREPSRCIDCAKCAKACPAVLPVDKLVTIRSAECTACLECVAACPAEGALNIAVRRRPIPAWAIAAGIAVIFLGITTAARLAGHWNTNIPSELYQYLVPHAQQFTHP
jgi:polyferredoxin